MFNLKPSDGLTKIEAICKAKLKIIGKIECVARKSTKFETKYIRKIAQFMRNISFLMNGNFKLAKNTVEAFILLILSKEKSRFA